MTALLAIGIVNIVLGLIHCTLGNFVMGGLNLSIGFVCVVRHVETD